MTEHVILFTGPMGAGKTTAIQSLSDVPVVHTEADNTERHIADKPTTTVALDYGEITLGADEKVRLYGTPGQRRFDFMWAILRERARGMVLLINNDATDPIDLVAVLLVPLRPGDFLAVDVSDFFALLVALIAIDAEQHEGRNDQHEQDAHDDLVVPAEELKHA